MDRRFELQCLEKAGCLLRAKEQEWRFQTTLEALAFARTQTGAEKARVEVLDEKGRRFMVVKL